MSTCELIQEALALELHADVNLSTDQIEHISRCEGCREFAEDAKRLHGDMAKYRREVIEPIVPSRFGQATLSRTLMELVREDVRERFTTSRSLRPRVGAWARRCLDTWVETVQDSTAFRWAVQAAVVIGVGLFLAALYQGSGGKETHLAADTREFLPVRSLPIDLDAPQSRDAVIYQSTRMPREGIASPVKPRRR